MFTETCHDVLCWDRCIKSTTSALNFHVLILVFFVCFWRDSPQWTMASSFTRFVDHTQRRTKVGRTPLDDWSARRRDPYLTTNNHHNIQTSIPPMGFEPTFSAGERPQTYALDRAVTGTGLVLVLHPIQHKHMDFPCKRFASFFLCTSIFSVQSSVHLFAAH